MKNKAKTVRDVGERGLIRQFQRLITRSPEALLIGNEDAVAVGLDGDALVINTDMLVASTDVLPGMTPAEIAWKVVVMGLSDLAAKGAIPHGIVVSFGLPEDTEETYAIALVSGLDRACREHDTYYLGGDTNQCSELVLDCAAIGRVPRKQLVRRKGAKPGDVVAVTGQFGYTGALFDALLKNRELATPNFDIIRRKALQPRARLREGRELAVNGLVSSAIDSSDGLAWSLYELATASRVGFKIETLPIPPICFEYAEAHQLDVYDLGLYGGEEFELVVTIPPNRLSSAIRAVVGVGGQLFPIGNVTVEQENVLVIDGERRLIESRGYEHFS